MYQREKELVGITIIISICWFLRMLSHISSNMSLAISPFKVGIKAQTCLNLSLKAMIN